MENKENTSMATPIAAPRILVDTWTRTAGRELAALPQDWDEAFAQVAKEKKGDADDGYSTRFVTTVWEWAHTEFGKDAKNMSMVELAEYWYEFG